MTEVMIDEEEVKRLADIGTEFVNQRLAVEFNRPTITGDPLYEAMMVAMAVMIAESRNRECSYCLKRPGIKPFLCSYDCYCAMEGKG